MTSRIQTNRFTATGARPPSTRPVGEVYFNFAENQLGVMADAAPVVRDLLPLRIHTPNAQYSAGHLVWRGSGGRVYRAKATVPPKTFAYADWIGITDVVNIRDFGALMDGTVNVDGPAIGAALATLQPNQSIFFPGGTANFLWSSVQGTTPTFPVLFHLDGTLSSGRMNRAFNRNNMGDMFENYYQGSKLLSVMSAKADQPPMLHLEYDSQAPGGSPGGVTLPIFITARDNAAAVTSLWGLGVALNSYADVNDPGNWPQQVGVSATIVKYGKAWCTGIHITAQDNQNLPSSTGGTLLGMELGHHVSGDDDGNLSGSPGSRYGIHMSQSEVAGGATPAVFAMGYQHDGTPNAITKSLFGVTGSQTYQVFDARTATKPPGYTDPVAALRMDHEMIVDFNGANTVLNTPGWKGPAGNYLQYTTTGVDRLRYMDGTTEVFNVSDTGSITTLASFNLPTGAGFSSDTTYTTLTMDSGNYRMRYTRANGLLQYLRGPDSVELWSVDSVGNSKLPGTLAVTSTLTVGGKASIGGTGVTYTGVASNNHAHAFGWDGTHTYSFVDGTNQGPLATLAELADHLPLSGGTITGNLTVSGGNVLIGSGTLAVSGTIGSNGLIAALGDIYARGGHYYFGAADQAVLNTTAAGTSLRFSADGWALSWNASNGTLAFFNNASVPLFTVDAAGNGVFHGTVHGTNVTLMEDQINLLQARIAALEGFSP